MWKYHDLMFRWATMKTCDMVGGTGGPAHPGQEEGIVPTTVLHIIPQTLIFLHTLVKGM
jgi:hypothetical protein